MGRMMEGKTILEQLYLAAFITYDKRRVCVIDFEDDQGNQCVTGTVQYFTNNMVCMQSGQWINIKDIRRITC